MASDRATIDRIYDVASVWFTESPYFATFLLRFKYVESTEFSRLSVPTMAVAALGENKVPTIIYNEEFCSGLTDEELEGLLYHEILHITSLNQERQGDRDAQVWNIATDAVNNEDIVNTRIGGRLLVLPKGGVRMKQLEDNGYTGPYIAEHVADFLEDTSASIKSEGNGQGGDGQGQEEEESEEKDGPTTLQPVDDHRLLEEALSDPQVQKAFEEIVKDARSKSWGSHEGGEVIQIDDFYRKKPKVDPRAIIHRHVANCMFSNRGEYHYTWTRRNRRGYPIPGKRRAEDDVLVFLDVSGSTFSQEVLSKFFNEIDYLASRRINIRLITFDTHIREDMVYKQYMWKNHQFRGGGGTFAQPIFEYLRSKGKTKYPVLIFTDGIFEWSILKPYGVKPFWVFSKSEFYYFTQGGEPFGKHVVLGEE